MMRGIRPAVTVFLACLIPAACTQPDAGRTGDQFPALGTLVEVTLRAGGDERDDAAMRAVRDAFDHAQTHWDAWGEGELGRLNAALATGEPVRATPGMTALLERAAALERASGGLFNPMVGWLVEAWGFHRDERPDDPPPDGAALERWLSLELTLTGTLARTGDDPERGALSRIDLGAFAKGVAIEDAIARLEAHGIEHAIVNAGGDIAVIGDAGGRPWRIGVRDPRGAGVFAGIELADGEAIFTSGDYERAFEHMGVRHHHIIDPRTGVPARGTASMTVVHREPALADAASTALFVAGDDWARVARSMGVSDAMRVDARGAVEILSPLAGRVRFEREPASVTVIDVEAR